MIKPLTRKDSVEISIESKNNSDITKNNAFCSERAIATNTTEDMQNTKLKWNEILGMKIDNNLNFNSHIKSICRKAGQKLSALLRISSNLNMKQKKNYINEW